MKLTIGRLSIELRQHEREEVSWRTSSANATWDAFRFAHPNLAPGDVCRDGACIPCHA